MKISARNTFSGRITAMSLGPVSTEVTIPIAPKLEIVSVITTNSAKKLKLKVGSKAYAIVKSDNVIVGVAVVSLVMNDLARIDLNPLQCEIDMQNQSGKKACESFRHRQQDDWVFFGNSFQRRPRQEAHIHIRLRRHIGK